MFWRKRERIREYIDGIAVDVTKTNGVKFLVFTSRSADICVPMEKVDLLRSALDETMAAARQLV